MGTIIGSLLSDPQLLGAVALDYDLSNPATMERSVGGGGGNPGNNDPVGYVLDQSGNGLHLEAPSGAGRPTFQTNVNGTAGAVFFNGTSQWLERLATSNVSANRGAMTIYAVVKHTTAPSTRQPYVLLSAEASNLVRIEHGASGTDPNKLRGAVRRANADTLVPINGTTNIGTGVRFVTQRIDYTNNDFQIYLNGSQEATGVPPGTSGANTQNINGRVYVGGQGAVFMDGHIFRLIAFHAAHNAAQRTAVWDYLRRTYQIT
jgi:hypothetical protein